jgi:alkyl sulfatase BDS1-like metallo-beta-lactamase superfamily hydrolase
MTIASMKRTRERGGVSRVMLVLLGAAVLLVFWLVMDDDAGTGIKKQAELKTLEVIGDAAARRLDAGGRDEGTHGSAVDLIRRPIEVRQVADNVYYATGVGNTIMITTEAGNVIFDTGLVLQVAKQIKALKAVSDAPVRYIVLSHSHADHTGGTRYWLEEGTEIVAHGDFLEEQRYLSELEPYQYRRNRTLFPWMPAWEDRPDIAMMRYGGIEPTITVRDWETYGFTLGGVDFQVIGTPGAEGADNAVLWLPEQRILFTGDFFGPQFPQFPNVFTMRGEKIRKPVEYILSLDLLIGLEPEIVVPSHLDPTVGGDEIREGMTRIRDAVQYVHDQTVAGMNAGKPVHQLMKEIQLPPHLELVQNHGKVDWAVRSIYDYYATWFHFRSTTELYPVPVSEVYAELAEAAGSESILSLAANHLARSEPVKALHLVEVELAANPDSKAALGLRKQALEVLMQRARDGVRNDYEIYWLQSRLADTEARLSAEPGV